MTIPFIYESQECNCGDQNQTFIALNLPLMKGDNSTEMPVAVLKYA